MNEPRSLMIERRAKAATTAPSPALDLDPLRMAPPAVRIVPKDQPRFLSDDAPILPVALAKLPNRNRSIPNVALLVELDRASHAVQIQRLKL